MVTYIGDGSSTSTTGSTAGDFIFGGGGSDTIFGGKGDDTLGAGTDQTGAGAKTADMTYIYGGQGDDTIYSGNAGSNYISGDLDNDRIIINAGLTHGTIYGGQGDDSINASAATGAASLTIYGDDNTFTTVGGNDTISTGVALATVYGGQGDDSITGGAAVSGSSSAFFGGQGDDTITSAAIGGVTLYGGQNDDTLTVSGMGGTSASDQHWVFGNLGNDTITVSGAAATVFGGQGFDTINASGSNQNNVLHGDLGNDSITAGTGSDTIFGGFGADTLVSGTGTGTTFHDLTGETTSQRVSYTASDGSTQYIYDQSNTDMIEGFRSGTDHVALQGHTALVNTGNIVTGNYASLGAAADFRTAYSNVYGNETGTNHGYFAAAPGVEYVSETVGTNTYLFVNDSQHTTIEFAAVGGAAVTFQTNDVIAG